MEANDIDEMLEKKPEAIKEEANRDTNSYSRDDEFYKNIQFDHTKVSSDNKSFTVVGQDPITSDIEERIMTIVPMLMKNKYIMRMGGDSRNTLEEFMAPLHMYKEIYLPWGNSNKLLAPSATRKKPSDMAYRVAVNTFIKSRVNADEAKFNDLPFGVKSSLGKDSHILFGNNLDNKIGFIIIYTECGSTRFTKDVDFKKLGITSNWIKYAKDLGIKIYNLKNSDSYNELKMILSAPVVTESTVSESTSSDSN